MSTLRVSAERLTIHPHPNADALELAQVGLYRAVVAKGHYSTGQYAIYIPEQAILPEELSTEFGLTGKLSGSKKNRVRAIRLRGELSQGIVCLPKALAGIDLAQAAEDRTDFADTLDITKWVPPVPVHMSGTGEPAPDLLSWPDIENFKRYPEIVEPGEPVVVTEKIHGTCSLVTYLAESDRVFVTSKGLGANKLALVENPENLYWRTLRACQLEEFAKQVAEQFQASRVGLFGEIYGHGVQDLHYGAKANSEKPGYALFDISIDVEGQVRWLRLDEIDEAITRSGLVISQAPVLYQGPFDLDEILPLAEGKETVSGKESHMREGIVIRPKTERYSPIVGGRAIAKIVSEAYLTRKNGTEYE